MKRKRNGKMLTKYEASRYVETYDQPFWDSAISWLYHRTVCNLPYKMVDWVDKHVAEPWHSRSCNDDCAPYWHRMVSWDEEPAGYMCGRTPIWADFDITCDRLNRKNNTNVQRTTTDRRPVRESDWNAW